jgi:hypothetical protein
VAVGVGSYLLLTHVLRVGEADALWRAFRDRRRRA